MKSLKLSPNITGMVLHDVQHHVRQRSKQASVPALRQEGNDPTGETTMSQKTERQNDRPWYRITVGELEVFPLIIGVLIGVLIVWVIS
jgi:hypothetical protein